MPLWGTGAGRTNAWEQHNVPPAAHCTHTTAPSCLSTHAHTNLAPFPRPRGQILHTLQLDGVDRSVSVRQGEPQRAPWKSNGLSRIKLARCSRRCLSSLCLSLGLRPTHVPALPVPVLAVVALAVQNVHSGQSPEPPSLNLLVHGSELGLQRVPDLRDVHHLQHDTFTTGREGQEPPSLELGTCG
ncbi:hypothetical protein M427DRAFT_53215 [Gonapodya prolifera JEL478]|uniref:Uncharacterized protein n=1 Tax=Gonapodya prolifera (strain JEL478) TaxID=1344416 RepID=A0A139ARI2_GONPJ|nr:hypothetical protein M427DRAFT_53215 [Gonapodya prolifera JEL478]|eukprot:KXS19264.1 hypothetical protein M427DRAFT_53215 [Gonapodya prolifera JEL478]